MHLKIRREHEITFTRCQHKMDIIYDIFTLRNVNRPYTDHELKEVYNKDHSIQDEDKRSRFSRSVSFNNNEDANVVKDATTVPLTTQSEVEKKNDSSN